MAQADGVVANASGAAVRTDINGQLAAVFSNHSGATQPSTIVGHMWWYDESAKILKIRNDADNGWVNVIDFNTTEGAIAFPAGTQALPSVRFGTNTTSGFYAPTNAADNEIALSMENHTYLKIGYNVAPSGTTKNRALFIGNAASLAAPKKPEVVTSSEGLTHQGIMIAELGRMQMCTHEGPGIRMNRTGNDGQMISFARDGATPVGHINMTTSAVSYNTGSDYRLKENVVNLTGAKSRLQQLLPKRFNFIGKTDVLVDGFLAHEAQAAVPESVTGTKDEIDSDGNAVYQAIDQSKLVPLLTAALQEAFAEIASLTNRVATLEAN